MEGFLQVASISNYAVVVNPADNVAVAKCAIEVDTLVELTDGRAIRVTGNVTRGNRFALQHGWRGSMLTQA